MLGNDLWNNGGIECSITLPVMGVRVFRYSTTYTTIPSFQYSNTPMPRPF